MNGTTSVEVGDDGVAVITINNPPLNLLSVNGTFTVLTSNFIDSRRSSNSGSVLFSLPNSLAFKFLK